MTAAAPPPHRLVLARPGFHALLAAASLLLSLWAVYMDPVINADGIGDVRATQYFLDAGWRAALEAGEQPVYAMLAAVLSRVTGMSAAHGLYALTAGFFALLVVGFVVLASILGGSRRAGLLAALLVLLLPALNGLRPLVSADPGYWAFYVWSLAYFIHYAASRERRSLAGWALATLAASLFAVEALVFLLVVPLWLLVHGAAGGRGRLLRLLVLAAGSAVLLGCALWVQVRPGGATAGQLLLHPVDLLAEGWREMGRALDFKLEALRGGFLDQYSRDYDHAALAATLLVLCVGGLVKALGFVYSILAGCALAVIGRSLAVRQRYWWGVFAVLSGLLLLVPALTRFAVDARDAMPAALTLLAIVPPALAGLWRSRSHGSRRRQWLLPVALVLSLALVIGAGVKGLDLRGQPMHLREAGLWLRAAAAPESSLYSNSRIIVYYSGLDGYRPGSDYSWQEAMTTVWRGQWRDHDYLALVITAGNEHREGILMRKLDVEPVKTFVGGDGDRVLIFDTRG